MTATYYYEDCGDFDHDGSPQPFDRDAYDGPLIGYPIFGIAAETSEAILFISDGKGHEGFWVPKSIIIDMNPPRTFHVGKTKSGKVYLPDFYIPKIIKIHSQSTASEDFSSFSQPTKKVNQMENHAQKVKTNHMLSMFQDNYTTVAVEFYCEKAALPANHAKLYTYKVPLDSGVKEDDLVIVPVGETDCFGFLDMHIAIVRAVHNAPEIDYDSQIIYRWVIQKVDLTAYNAILDNEKKFRDLMVQADKIQHREKLKQAFIELAGDSEAKSLLEQAIGLVSTSKQGLDH